jgi:hypothetical protein
LNKYFAHILIFILFFILSFKLVLAQAGNYYNSINPNSSTFITDLENRIRSPYTKISYDQFDETNIANFASVDNRDGTRSVFCVYSNYEYVYVPPFTWLPMSREHTFCYSWQPGYPSTSLPEYSDQHHLFPANQDNANGVRNNHPLGNVSSVISTFLDAKYGYDINGNIMYEPRDAHKGDAARALLYMAIRYDGINGYDWTFNWLNNTRLPSLSEGPEDLATLIQWSKQDPPDKWEVDRNNYIQSIQENRNPFVDHPEYINYINFNNLSKLSPTYATEPTNYVTNFSASASTSSITFNWTDALAGSQAPSNYLLIVFNRNNYFLPIDGETYPDDADLSDGKAVINISYSGADSYELTGLSNNTTYYGAIFSYNGSGTLTNYKIDGTFPVASVLFGGSLAAEPSNYVTNLAAGLVTSSSEELTWTKALEGAQAPTGYLLMANKTGIFSDPVDGTTYSNNTNLTGGSAIVNIPYTAVDNYTFSGLTSSTTYYYKIYSYNGSGNQINYKTDGTVPTLSVQTLLNGGGGGFTDLIISEYVEGSSNNKAIEIYNGTSSSIDLSADGYNLQYFFNGSTSAGLTINLAGTIAAGNVYVIAQSSASSTIISVTNQTNGSSWFNGNDAIELRKGTTILDVIGQVGFDPGTEWGSGLVSTADNTLRRKATVTQGDINPSDTFDPSIEWDGYAMDTFDGLGNPSPLPVELISFTARVINNKVLLNWQTATEINNFGFDILRQAHTSTPLSATGWDKIGFVSGNGNSNSPKDYLFEDNPALSGKYYYRLKQIDNDGQFEYSKIIEVTLNAPNSFELSQNYPNPFNPTTIISYTLPVAANVKLTVYNILGQEVKTLVNEYKEPGTYGFNFNASELNSGLYIYKLEAGSFIQVKKMMLLK